MFFACKTQLLSPLGETGQELCVSVCPVMGTSLVEDYTAIGKDFRSLAAGLMTDHLLALSIR
jgi:hypothetical protein